MIQQSFKNNMPSLFLVATPIGNLQEMTPRAIETLKTVDVIAAEDTRTTKKLLQHFDIKTHTISHHLHNEKQSSQGILDLLAEGKNVALVSDAGYPLISDPGQTLVSEVVKEGYNVVPISGSSAFLNALVASGLVAQPFAFMGFLEAKESQLRKQLIKNKSLPMTTIYYVSVHKLEKTLEIIEEEYGNRNICMAREITKLHEEFVRGTISEVREALDVVKGEFVLVIEAEQIQEEKTIEDFLSDIELAISNGQSVSRAIATVAKENGLSKNELYATYHENK